MTDTAATVVIRPAAPGDLSAVRGLLEETGLQTSGVDEHFTGFLVATDGGGRVLGSAGLEFYGAAALLRSVAVAPALRGQGLGVRLVDEALAAARRRGVRRVTLLTDTAGTFFARQGFRGTTRDELDARLLASGLFDDPTCINALVMVMDLESVSADGRTTQREEATP